MKNRQKIRLIILFFSLACGSQILQGQSNEAIREIRLLLDDYQFDKAALVADQSLQTDSTNVHLVLLKGKALVGSYKYNEAKTAFLKVIRLDSANIPGWFDLVNVYRQLGNPEMAIAACKRILQIDSANRFFILQLSNLYYNNEKFEKAKNVLIPLYYSDTTDLYVMKQLGQCFSEIKKPDSAIFFFNKVIGRSPLDAVVASRLINLYIKIKSPQRGLDVSEIYLAIDSTNMGILQMNGYCNYLLHDYRLAEKRFLQGIALGDETKFTHKYLGLCYYKQELYDLAEPLFAKAFRMDTTDSEVCFYYGVSSYRSMMLDTGLVYLNKTYKLLMPSSQFLSAFYTELAGVYNELGKCDTALAILIKAREENPENSTYLFRIAYQYDYYLNHPKEALAFYQEYLRMVNIPRRDKYQIKQPSSEPTESGPSTPSADIDPMVILKTPQHFSKVEFAYKRIEELLTTLKKQPVNE